MAEPRKKPPTPRRPRAASPKASSSGAGSGDTGRYDDGHDDDGEENQESVAAHALFVERHFGGGAPASAELLDSANRVWRQLPGAVVGVAGLVRPTRLEPTPEPPDRTGDDR
jgi:hypothetical protein